MTKKVVTHKNERTFSGLLNFYNCCQLSKLQFYYFDLLARFLVIYILILRSVAKVDDHGFYICHTEVSSNYWLAEHVSMADSQARKLKC